MDEAQKKKLKWAGIGLLSFIIIAYGIQHSVPYKQEAPNYVQQVKAEQEKERQQKVGVLESGDKEQATSYICAQSLVESELYPSDVSFGLFGVTNATFVRNTKGEIRVTGLFNIVDYRHEFNCLVDISDGQCSGTCTYM